MEEYESRKKQPLKITLPNSRFTIYGQNPPSSGVIYQYILNILDGYGFKKEDLTNEKSKINVFHKVTEAFKFAYAKRSNLGDEEFVNGTEELIRNLTSSDYASYIRSRINESKTYNISYYEPDFDIVDDSGTAHVSIIHKDTAVALTSTINLP